MQSDEQRVGGGEIVDGNRSSAGSGWEILSG